ncbi:MAG: hypothetical protein UY18_C0013G0019 [Microgenomates group bacterium GW2011_GWF2_47_9]|nr:MAG: hypothetical protein UY18_C0013G0019 [Microgenomates group bacterium GW2011_GWF2_47_9]
MKLIKVFALSIVLLMVLSVTLSNRSLDDSQEVREITETIASLEHDNTLLRAEIASVGSLTAVAEKASSLGWSTSPKIVTLSLSGRVASLK